MTRLSVGLDTCRGALESSYLRTDTEHANGAHQMEHRAALNVVVLCQLIIIHLLAGEDQPVHIIPLTSEAVPEFTGAAVPGAKQAA